MTITNMTGYAKISIADKQVSEVTANSSLIWCKAFLTMGNHAQYQKPSIISVANKVVELRK